MLECGLEEFIRTARKYWVVLTSSCDVSEMTTYSMGTINVDKANKSGDEVGKRSACGSERRRSNCLTTSSNLPVIPFLFAVKQHQQLTHRLSLC